MSSQNTTARKNANRHVSELGGEHLTSRTLNIPFSSDDAKPNVFY